MTNKSERNITPSSGGTFNEFTNYIKLVFRLLGDKRVNPFSKILPFITLIYFIVPDLIPGPIDDAFIVWLGTYFFIELCPKDVVQEHRDALNNSSKTSKPSDVKIEKTETQIEDAEFWDKEQE